MVSPGILVRVTQKLFVQLQHEAHTNNESVPQLIRNILFQRITRKTRAHKNHELAYGFAGPAHRKIKTFEDWFSGPPHRKIKTYEDWFSGPPGSAREKKKKQK